MHVSFPRASRRLLACLLVAVLAFTAAGEAAAQDRTGGQARGATLTEEEEAIKTYPFSDADPVPDLYIEKQIYPYFRYDGFSHTGKDQPWNVIRMENPYIAVSVMPELGGKVWGAVEQSTGQEFIYENDVVKFRDIGLRGPWTSGGIEHNFSIFGHTPTTSTPVDYLTRTNDDGSVSVVVGATDWTSRTKWRVTMTVPPEAAYLDIETLWFNPTPLPGTRYHWLNAAAAARDDLQFFFPGDYYVGHGGDAHPWPVDEQGRDRSFYKNSDFGRNHSYHVLGEYADFYGGYYHDTDFGFGHWAPYEDVPGKKIWIWSHARSGAIWEDLLTDTKGQYIEAQAGRKFNQTRISKETPFVQKWFPPYMGDRWSETWFPVKETGGITDAARYGVLNVTRESDALKIRVNALEPLRGDSLTVTVGGQLMHGERLDMAPMDVIRRTVTLPEGRREEPVAVTVGDGPLRYTSDEAANDLDRPLRRTIEADEHSAEALYRAGERQGKAGKVERAMTAYRKVLDLEPTHTRARIRMAELYYRRAQYAESIAEAEKALQFNTYDADANFVYGIAQRAMGDLVNAKEALGWAARSMKHRAGAYTQMAGVHLQEGAYEQAEARAREALRFNPHNLSAYEALAISLREQGEDQAAQKVLAQLLDVDPLSHFARFEQHLLDPSEETRAAFTSMIRNELPDETYLELAVQYANRGQTDEALRVLNEAPDDPIVHYWAAYLLRDRNAAASAQHLDEALAGAPWLVFPFRRETMPVLAWAAAQGKSWKTPYYLGTLYWSKDRKQEAADWYARAGDAPDFAAFYTARALLREERQGEPEAVARDLHRATEVDENAWRSWRALIRHYNDERAYEEALRASRTAHEAFPNNYYIGLEHAATLLNTENYAESARVLENIDVLPSEGAKKGHDLFEQAYVRLALENLEAGDYTQALEHLERSKEWPEHLGVGKPSDTDVRLQNYMAAYAYRKMDREEEARERLEAIRAYTESHRADWSLNHYLSALALKALGHEGQAQRLIADWQRAAGTEDLAAQWAAARFNQNEAEAQALADQLRAREAETEHFDTLNAFIKMREP